MREPDAAGRHGHVQARSTTRSSASATTSTTAARRSWPASSRCRAAGTSSSFNPLGAPPAPFCKCNQIDPSGNDDPPGQHVNCVAVVQRLPAVLARAPTCRSAAADTDAAAALPFQEAGAPFGTAQFTRQRRGLGENQDNIYSFLTTSSILPAADLPAVREPSRRSSSTARRRSTRRRARTTRSRRRPTTATSGCRATVDLTGKTTADLSFTASYDTEPGWDYLIVEAHTVGQDDWTTLPDANGHTTERLRATAAARRSRSTEEHPFMAHYVTLHPETSPGAGDATCDNDGHDGHVQRAPPGTPAASWTFSVRPQRLRGQAGRAVDHVHQRRGLRRASASSSTTPRSRPTAPRWPRRPSRTASAAGLSPGAPGAAAATPTTGSRSTSVGYVDGPGVATERHDLLGLRPRGRDRRRHAGHARQGRPDLPRRPLSAAAFTVRAPPLPGRRPPVAGYDGEGSSRRSRASAAVSATTSPSGFTPMSTPPWRRTETVRASASRPPSTSMTGTFCTSASWILRPTFSSRASSSARRPAARSSATTSRLLEPLARRRRGSCARPSPRARPARRAGRRARSAATTSSRVGAQLASLSGSTATCTGASQSGNAPAKCSIRMPMKRSNDAEQRAVDHERALELVLARRVGRVEALRHPAVELDRAHLPAAPDRVGHVEVDLGRVERAVAGIHGVVPAGRRERRGAARPPCDPTPPRCRGAWPGASRARRARPARTSRRSRSRARGSRRPRPRPGPSGRRCARRPA